MSDLELDRDYKRTDSGPKVKLIQEWLSLNGFQLTSDGDFGAATEFAVKQFQAKAGLTQDGIVGPLTFARLIQPMTDALKAIPATAHSLRQLVVLHAQPHQRQVPREVGGQNRGPSGRPSRDGNEGQQ